VKRVAEEEGYPILTPERPWGEDFSDQVRSLAPELFVVVAYGQLLKPEILDLPPRGGINVHPSLLPELRGAAPIAWAILRGHRTTGVTIMRMVEAMDAGPILLQTPEKIGPFETATELGTRLSEVGAEALVEALALMAEGAIEEVEQDHSLATFAPKLDRQMARIDWARPADEVGCHIRGLDAVPGAWTELTGERVKLFGPRPEPRFRHGAQGGTILEGDSEEGLLVACGSGAIRIGEIQSPGKKRMAVGDWLRGHGLPEEARFE
jgi:methionyl-tRNA formyltransferase